MLTYNYYIFKVTIQVKSDDLQTFLRRLIFLGNWLISILGKSFQIS